MRSSSGLPVTEPSRSGCQPAESSRTSAPAAASGPGGDLAGAGVHAWLVDLDATADIITDRDLLAAPDLCAARALLSPAERHRAASYLRRRDGLRFAASRAWLRVILSRCLAADPQDLRFVPAADGRPALAESRYGALHYSLSRSAGRCLVAVSRSPVGADIERVDVRAGLADLVTGRFALAEVDCLAAGCGGTKLRGFYRHWTAKEAFLKATGIGLTGLRDTALVCGQRPVIEFARKPAPCWTVSFVEPVAGYVATVVSAGPVTTVAA